MLFKFASVLTLVVPLISALTLNTPENLSSGGSATITWTNAAGDASTFSLELINTVFNRAFAIANNVSPSSGTITLVLPSVPPGDGYSLQAVNIGDISNVYATSGDFSIAAESTSTTTSTTTSSSSGSSTSSTSRISYTPPGSSSGFGTTNTSPASTTSATSSTTKTSSSGTSSSTSGTFNAASSMKFGINAGSIATVLFSVVAGAVVIAL